MIRQLEYYHGAALLRLCRGASTEGVTIARAEGSRAGYVLDNRAGVYLKYSTKRLSPWGFSFRIEHQSEIDQLAKKYEGVFLILICGLDGIACLDIDEYRRVLDEDPQPGEWIKAVRLPRHKYSITGSDDRSVFKIGDNEYPAKVLAALDKSNCSGPGGTSNGRFGCLAGSAVAL